MKRNQRIIYITQKLITEPGKIFPLKFFCDELNTSKSTLSEDISIIKNSNALHGKVITISGPQGGVKYIPHIDELKCLDIQQKLSEEINNPHRFLGGGFLYTSDIMFNHSFSMDFARIFAHKYADLKADYIVTIETKGIPLAIMVGKLLNLPTVVVRREPKISEGPTISINYFSGSTGRMQKMSISKKAMLPGSKAIIIDDFMRAGGSIKGICELLSEVDVEVLAVGVAIATTTPADKKISSYDALVFMDEVDDKNKKAKIYPNYLIF